MGSKWYEAEVIHVELGTKRLKIQIRSTPTVQPRWVTFDSDDIAKHRTHTKEMPKALKTLKKKPENGGMPENGGKPNMSEEAREAVTDLLESGVGAMVKCEYV